MKHLQYTRDGNLVLLLDMSFCERRTGLFDCYLNIVCTDKALDLFFSVHTDTQITQEKNSLFPVDTVAYIQICRLRENQFKL